MVYLSLPRNFIKAMSKAEKTKSFIIEKTAPIFNMKGYAGTSMQDMTDATGLTKGSIYGNFKNKDDVALAVFEYNRAKMVALFSTEISKRKTNAEKLLAYPDLYENFFSKNFLQGGCPIMNTAIEADDTHPKLKMAAQRAILEWKDSIAYIIERGKESNEFKKTTNSEEIALSIISMIEGAVMITKLTGKIDSLKLILHTLKKLINDL